MIDVGAVGDFPDRSVTLVRAGSREIGIVRWDDEVYAVSNICAHQRGPLCRGTLGARLTAAAPGELELDEETPVLACPWHGWEFDVRTGRALFTLGDQEIEAMAGQVLVAPAGTPHKFKNLGPGLLETIDIHASDRFITDWLE